RSCSRSPRPSPCRTSTRACGSVPRSRGACARTAACPVQNRAAARYASEFREITRTAIGTLLRLKGNVVVGGTEVGVRVRRRGRRNELALASAALPVAAAAEELHGVGDDLDRLALRAVLGLPLAPVEAAVDADRPALREEL